MGSTRRKTVLWLAGLSLIAVVTVAIFGRQRIVERWYIYRLGSDDSETVDYAARRLAEMGSTRAIAPLIEQVPREAEKGRRILWYFVDPGAGQHWTDSAVLKALYDLGEPARLVVEQHLGERRWMDSRVLIPPNPIGLLNGLLDALKHGRPFRYSRELPVLIEETGLGRRQGATGLRARVTGLQPTSSTVRAGL